MLFLRTDSKKVAFYTLGCKVNQYDSAAVAALFRKRGFEVVPFDEDADVYIVNTCTITATGDAKSRQVLRRARRKSDTAVVVAMGCYAQTDAGRVARTTGADLVFGTGDHHQIVDAVIDLLKVGRGNCERIRVRPVCEYDSFQDLFAEDALDRTRALVKIQDGCDQYCTYCKVPYARGRVRSRPLESVVEQVKLLVDTGYKEIVLIGTHLGLYGRDLSDKKSLASAAAAVAEIDGVYRVRFGSIECTEVTPELLDVMSSHGNICRHLHIPLQSGDDSVLRRMGRPYDTRTYLEAISAVRGRVEGCAISTDVMMGFPGETESEFKQSMRFVEECGFTRLHVFAYSRRPGTPAADAECQVARDVKARRVAEMAALGRDLSLRYHQTMIGRSFEVLVEDVTPDTDVAFGYTDTYVKVGVSSGRGAPARNTVVSVRVESADAECVYGVDEGDIGPV